MMIPLILLALGLGAALTVYELSPRARARVDTFVRAIRAASDAHQTADSHLGNATMNAATAIYHTQQAAAVAEPRMPMASQPYTSAEVVADIQTNAAQVATEAAVDQAVAAIAANQSAAKDTAIAAQNAQTEIERQAVVLSAAKVLEREKQLAAMLDSLGIGQCGARSYPGVTEQGKDTLLAKLRANGMAVTGNNPWNIDTGRYGVKLRAIWDWRVNEVKLIVTAGKGTSVIPFLKDVTCQDIWDKIEPIMKEVIG